MFWRCARFALDRRSTLQKHRSILRKASVNENVSWGFFVSRADFTANPAFVFYLRILRRIFSFYNRISSANSPKPARALSLSCP